MSTDWRPIVVRLPRDLYDQVKYRARSDDRTMAAEIRRALRWHLDQQEAALNTQAMPPDPTVDPAVVHLFAELTDLATSACCGLTWDNLRRSGDGTLLDLPDVRAGPDPRRRALLPHYASGSRWSFGQQRPHPELQPVD
jgi:hypothetical protein